MYELLLVSQSPRRKQLLEDAGFLFRVDTVKISENIGENVNVEAAILALASRAYIVNNGHVVHEGATAEIRANPEVLRRYLGV